MFSPHTFVSWNVNGVRSVARKGFINWLQTNNYDVVGLQETKVSDLSALTPEITAPDGYRSHWHMAKEKKGYSGVAVYTKGEPDQIIVDFGGDLLSKEGRLIRLDYGNLVFINGYFPNGKSSAERLDYKLKFYEQFSFYLESLLSEGRSIIFCGDINTAHREIDLARPKENEKISGFLPIEREWLDRFIGLGFTDTFRYFSDAASQYTWWDQKTRARDRNVGWRIDYFFVSNDLLPRLKRAFILADVHGSDHCPVGIELK